MGERSVILRFATRNLERARALGQAIVVTVDKGVQGARAARRELQAAARERIAQARVLQEEERRAKQQLGAPSAARGSAALGRARADQRAIGQGLNQGVTGARAAAAGASALLAGGGNLSAGLATQLAFLLPQTVITALAIQVTNQVMREVDARLALQQRAEEDLARVRAERAAETVAQRAKRDPAFEREANREAGEALRARRAYEARVGIEPTAARAAGE